MAEEEKFDKAELTITIRKNYIYEK
jgi:hypothetical protein